MVATEEASYLEVKLHRMGVYTKRLLTESQLVNNFKYNLYKFKFSTDLC